MSCFPCFRSQRSKKDPDDEPPRGKPELPEVNRPRPAGHHNTKSEENIDHGNIKSKNFTFRELATATKNFRQECLLGEGGFGRVYRGTLPGSGQVVAVKQLDRNGMQGNKEFIAEVSTLSLLNHENLVNLIGYCADGDQRLLVYEYVPGGPVENHLLDVGQDRKPLDWITRMKIACGVAQGLEYLHDKADPPVIYRDLKSSNVLLDENLNPKLSDFGLAKLGPQGDKFHVTPRVMGTYGYCAPEYTRTGDLTIKSDVYSFGVVLLELITGRRAMDTTKPNDEQNLVAWAQPKFRDPKLFPEMADPLLQKKFPEKALNQAVALTAMCLQEEASVRPLMSDVVATLSFLLTVLEDPAPAPARPDPSPALDEAARKSDAHSDHSDSSEEGGGGEGSETLDDESTEGGKGGGSVQKAASSRHEKGGSSRRMSRKESAASSNRNNGARLSEEGSISSSSSHGSVSSGHSNSKRSISSSDRKSSHGKFDSSLSRGHSKAYSHGGSSPRSRSSSYRLSSWKESGVFSSYDNARGSDEEDDDNENRSIGSSRSRSSSKRESHDHEEEDDDVYS